MAEIDACEITETFRISLQFFHFKAGVSSTFIPISTKKKKKKGIFLVTFYFSLYFKALACGKTLTPLMLPLPSALL